MHRPSAAARRCEVRSLDALSEMDLERVTDPVQRAQALEAVRQAEDEGESEGTLLGAAFLRWGTETNILEVLPRYEAAIERSIFRNLRELQALQAVRAGQADGIPRVAEPPVRAGEGVRLGLFGKTMSEDA